MAGPRLMTTLGSMALVAAILAGCSSSPPVSLANDQAAVNRLEALVQSEQDNLVNVAHGHCTPDPTQAGTVDCPELTPQQMQANTARAQRALTKNEFKLQVAKDQLKKDEG